MTQDEQDLLVRDLCMRLPYGVKVHYPESLEPTMVISSINRDSQTMCLRSESYCFSAVRLNKIKPYLRQMSSMTGSEVLEYISLKENIVASDGITYSFETYESIDYLNSHHFDYRGLIKKGLAIEAPEGMYNAKED